MSNDDELDTIQSGTKGNDLAGDHTMTSTLGNRLRFLILAVVALGALVVAPRANAQGYGPDPFRPWNSQYDAYIFPIGPSGPNAANGPAGVRSGLRGSNQFENYLSELQGADRSRVEKYGIGMPYYRSAVDPRFLRPDREYVPNFKSSRSFEQTQQRITEKYVAYFSERDPKKRAQLFKDYTRAQAQVSRVLSSARRGNATRVLEAAEEIVSPRQRAGVRDELDTRSRPTRDSRRGAQATDDDEPLPPRRSATRGTGDGPTLIPPAPAPPGSSSGRLKSRRSASDVLNRAQGLRDSDSLDLMPPPARPRTMRRPTTPVEPPANP
jgi:hypothetical protein